MTYIAGIMKKFFLALLPFSALAQQPTVVVAKNALTKVLSALSSIWNYPLFTIESNPISLGRIIFALILLIMGLRLSKKFSRLLRRRLFMRIPNLDRGASATFETLSFYILFSFFILFSFNVANIPLTMFTVFGGALAIGVGFGSQNIVNNFISGLIMMIERPIKVEDYIDVDGREGYVENIGARSTRIRTLDNTHIIVPNSSFLEKNVLNWTLSDSKVRISVTVGVAYGSPTRKVAELILKGILQEKHVLIVPQPAIFFKEFGDNALIFEGHFWVKVHGELERQAIQSNVRFNIDDLFREHKIVIAYPQRDLHLTTKEPLEIHLNRSPL